MIRIPLTFPAFVVLIAALLPALAQAPAPVEWKLWADKQELRVGDYVVTGEDRRSVDGYFYLRVTKGGAEALTLTSSRYLFHEPTLGQDITGRGKPAMAVLEWSGNDNCCYQMQVVEFADPPRAIGAGIDIQYIEEGSFPQIADRDGKPGLEVEVTDMWAFYADLLAGSPVPRVVLRLEDEDWIADGELMRKPPPSDAALMRLADESHDTYREAQVGQVWSELIASPVIALIYQGNIAAACRFHERAHPEDDYKEASLLKLLEDANLRRRRSEWKLWPALARANRIAETGALDCPR